jgi:hydroxyacylglutathione hydrolase
VADVTPPPGSLVRPIPLGRVNAYLIRGRRPVLVDTGTPGNTPTILAAIRDEGYDPRDLALIIITHAHVDHFGSAAAISAATGAPVLAPAGEEDVLRSGAGLSPVPASFFGRIFAVLIGKTAPSPDLAVNPAVLADAPFRLDAYGIDGVVEPTHGHTRWSLSVRLATGEWIVGDLVMGMFPPGRAGLPLFAEDLEAVKQNIRMITDTKPAIIYAGHGGPFCCSQLEALLQVT